MASTTLPTSRSQLGDRDASEVGDAPAPVRHLFYLACFFIPALAIRGPAAVTVSDLLFVASAGLLFVTRPRPARLPGALHVAAFLTALGGMTALVRADSIGGSVGVLVRLLYIMTIWPWQAALVLNTERRIWRAGGFWIAGCATSALAALAQTQLPTIIPNTKVVYGRIPGLAQHVTDAGGTFAIVLPFAIGALIYQTRRRPLVASAAALSLVALLLTGSVSGILSAFMGMVVLGLQRKSRLVALLLVPLLAVVGYAGSVRLQTSEFDVSPLERIRVTTGGGRERESNTLSVRLETDRAAVRGILDQPLFGRGLDEGSAPVYRKFATHNMLLLSWYQGGLLVFVGVMIMLSSIAAVVLRATPRSTLGPPLLASLASAFVFAMTSPLLYARYLWFPGMLVIALWSLLRRKSVHPLDTAPKSQGRRPIRVGTG
jgi:hypothetical protein